MSGRTFRILAALGVICLSNFSPAQSQERITGPSLERSQVDPRLRIDQPLRDVPTTTPSGFAEVRNAEPPVYFGLKHNVYTIAICVTHNSADQNPDNDWIEFHTYEVDAGSEPFRGIDEVLLGIDYAEFAVKHQAALEREKGSTGVYLTVNRECEAAAAYATRRPKGERTIKVSDFDRAISKEHRPFWRSKYGYHTVWKRLGCERSWNGHCRIEETMELQHLKDILDPDEMQVCSYYFNDTHLSGWHADYRIAPIVSDVNTIKPDGYVTGYYLSLKANGNDVPFDRIGARVDLENIGMSYVSRDASTEDMTALKCNARITTYRTSKKSRTGAVPPRTCIDSDGVGYYCTNDPRSGSRANVGITIGNF